jgi:hypothetical protein
VRGGKKTQTSSVNLHFLKIESDDGLVVYLKAVSPLYDNWLINEAHAINNG